MKHSLHTETCHPAPSAISDHQTMSETPPLYNYEFWDASGQIPYNMTNDYMFRAVLQSNNKVLRGLICSLLHLSEQEVISVEITNPIILGETVTDKEFRLDINVNLNNHTLINLEMQIANKLNWRERSVMYLCRSFDHLSHGQNYSETKSAIHIGFLDYTLFNERPEFYASYKLINVKNHQKYSDSLTLNVVDLSRIDLATAEDKHYHIHEWALLFKSTTWEEIKMLASKDEYLQEASETIFRMSADDLVRKRCRDREEYYQDLRNYERKIELDRIEHEQDIRNYKLKIEQERLEHEQDIRDYKQKIEQDRLEHEQDIRDYKQKIEQDRLEHEQDIRDYKQKIEQNRLEHEQKIEQERLEHEQDIRDYKQKIEQDRLEHEQKIEQDRLAHEQAIAEKDALIRQLLAENEALKKQEIFSTMHVVHP